MKKKAPPITSPQRRDEWEKIDADGIRYHSTQWETPKKSTIAFEKFIAHKLEGATNVIDFGAGAGAATAFLAQNHDRVKFTGFDYSDELVALGSKIASDKKIGNIAFQLGDWFNMQATREFDGAISLQTLSWLPDYEAPLIEVLRKVNPKWLGITSLFYEGDITCRTEVEEHTKQRKFFCNVYSLPAVARTCEREGYVLSKVVPFEIDIDLERPSNLDVMGTYTRRVANRSSSEIERIQISGPLPMSWHMILIERL